MKMTNDAPASETSLARRTAPARGRYRLLSNYSFQLLNQLLRIGSMLLLVPLYLAAWGTEVYKDWILIFAVATFLSTCSLGLTTYFGNRFIELVARHDRTAFQRELRLALTCAFGVGVVVAALGIALALASSESRLWNTSAMGDPTLLACLVLMISAVPLSFCEETLVTIYRAQGEFSRGECVFSIQLSALLIGTAALLALGMTPIFVAGWFLCIQVMVLVGVVIDLRRRYEGISLGVETPSLAELKHIVPRSLLFFTSPLSMALVQNGPIMLFGVLGVPAVPVVGYTLVRTVTGLARQAAYVFAIGSGIEMARHNARDERSACHELYRITGQIVTGLAGLFGGFTLWATAPFLALWTHGTVHGDFPLVLAFLGGILLSAPGQAGLMLLTYSNVPKPVALAWCSQAVLGLVLAAAFVPVFGVTAAALGLAIGETLMIGLYLPFAVQRHFGFAAGEHFIRCFTVGGVAFAWSALVAGVAFDLALGGFSGFILMAALWAVLAAPPCVLLVLPPQHKKRLLSRIRRLAANLA